MAYNFLPCDRNQTYLLPPSLTDWLPEDHLAWFVLDAVEQIDLSQFYKKYRTDGVGNSAFNPSMMVGLLIYSYCTGEQPAGGGEFGSWSQVGIAMESETSLTNQPRGPQLEYTIRFFIRRSDFSYGKC